MITNEKLKTTTKTKLSPKMKKTIITNEIVKLKLKLQLRIKKTMIINGKLKTTTKTKL